MMWTETDDGSVIDQAGKVVHFSLARFVDDICIGNCCFICGATPESKHFNDEHILPEWVLRKFELFSDTISLPNDAKVRYDKYRIPCCAECNSAMGKNFETPLSRAFRGGYVSLTDFARNGGAISLFVWMGLIFLKTHLKDQSLRANLDARKGVEKIGDHYDWRNLHHLHCVVRSFYSGSIVEPEALGSLLLLPVQDRISPDNFDYADLYLSQVVMLRLDDVAIFSVFNDSAAVFNLYQRNFDKIAGPVSSIQLREILADLAFLNFHLEERPEFKAEIDFRKPECRLVGKRKSLRLRKLDSLIRGKLMTHVLREVVDKVEFNGRSRSEVIESLRAGKVSFLFGDDGKFISDSWKKL